MSGNDNQKDSGKRNPWSLPNNQGPDDRDSPKGGWSPRGPRQDDQNDLPDFQDFLNQIRGIFSGGGQVVLLLIALLAILWLGSGIYRVQPGENAVIKRFGAVMRAQVQPGLGYHLPWPIESATKLNVMIDRRIQIGFSDNGVSSSRNDNPAESLMLTADANIVDIDVVVLWNIAEAQDYLFTIRGQENTIKQVSESAIREVVGQTRLQSIITDDRNNVAERIRKTMQGVLDSYKSGVAIKQVLILEATVHPDVLEAYNDVAAARQDAERFQNEATIYRNDILPKARGEAIKMEQDAEAYASQAVSRAKGDAERFTETLDGYRSGKDVTRDRIYIDTMEEVLSNANRLVIDQEGGGAGVLPYLSLDAIRKSQETEGNLTR
ncbi:MAG TPA: FtsH protease activity modulator HflK [Alphaproteobacteria bacterium]